MKEKIRDIIKDSIKIKEALLTEKQIELMEKASRVIISAIREGGKVLVFGNGGSAADSQHMVAELVGRFQKDRRPIPAIALTTNTSTLTAVSNDYGYERSFLRQVEALGKRGDVAIGISTSGNSRNVIEAIKKARALGLSTIAFTGGNGGALAKCSELAIIVPSTVTARIQESHITLGHIICQLAEDELSGQTGNSMAK